MHSHIVGILMLWLSRVYKHMSLIQRNDGHDARKPVFERVCKQQNHRPACVSGQSDQRLSYPRGYMLLRCLLVDHIRHSLPDTIHN